MDRWRRSFLSYLFKCKVAWTKRFLDFPVASLLRRLDGGSKSVQNAFERKLFHIGPSDFPKFLLLFRFNCDDLFFIYSTFTNKNYLFSISCFMTRYNFHFDRWWFDRFLSSVFARLLPFYLSLTRSYFRSFACLLACSPSLDEFAC